ncbi:alkylated DNA repair protein alkB-like 8 [Achlya hypogyna]|uniref:tRNA (carboxymethyluridine(34)-5-O)-methyltransferase n=1 Tax=Achlya hypogyna TaxID=1202772 RepID=A0A1V9ZSZ7_ACHHY|nr:alkylated DNA repair protein alkB-like 8 [Achlya hypogyna]
MAKPSVRKPKVSTDTNLLTDRVQDPEAPSRYLYVANCTVGGDHGVGEGAILACFGAFGALCDLFSEDTKGYVLLTFSTVESAAAAREALNGTSPQALGSRKLFIQFAAEASPASASGSSLSCPSTTAQLVVPGLSIIENFVSRAEEADLIAAIDARTWEDSIQRRVQHYGYAFRYDSRDVDVNRPLGRMPEFCRDMTSRLHELRPDLDEPDQITVNEYLPGQGIAPHVDTSDVFTEYIASASLGADIIMDFRLVNDPRVVKHVLLKRGSLCLMVGEARYLWKHGIAYRKHDLIEGTVAARSRRVSMTFRKVLADRDMSRIVQSVQMPSPIEKEHVHGVYDSIASHFSHTRHHPWPLVTAFLESLPDGALVADIGCGNGKYLGANKNIMAIGSDRSIPLLSVCAERDHEVFGSDGLAVPLRSGLFDAAICIAVLHHMSTIEHRLQILRELARLVKVGGQVYVVAWAFEQDSLSKRKFDTQDVMVEWKLQQKYIDTNEPLPAHVQLDDEKKWAVYQRYCHVYRDLELESLVRQVPGLVVRKVEMMRSNWCLTIDRV